MRSVISCILLCITSFSIGFYLRPFDQGHGYQQPENERDALAEYQSSKKDLAECRLEKGTLSTELSQCTDRLKKIKADTRTGVVSSSNSDKVEETLAPKEHDLLKGNKASARAERDHKTSFSAEYPAREQEIDIVRAIENVIPKDLEAVDCSSYPCIAHIRSNSLSIKSDSLSINETIKEIEKIIKDISAEGIGGGGYLIRQSENGDFVSLAISNEEDKNVHDYSGSISERTKQYYESAGEQ